MKDGAGRSSSPLDEIRPQKWTSEMTRELLELLWVLEATVEMFPALKQTLEAVIAGETFRADELPQPTAAERKPPEEEESESEQSAKQDSPQHGTEWQGFEKNVYRKPSPEKPKRKRKGLRSLQNSFERIR